MMKSTVLTFVLALCLPLSIFAQTVEGDWATKVPTEDGTMMTIKLSLKAGNYQVDMGNDGTTEVEGTYTVDGKTITVQDTGGEMACTGEGTAGVYTFTVDNASFVMTRVSDGCKGRGGPEGMSFTKM